MKCIRVVQVRSPSPRGPADFAEPLSVLCPAGSPPLGSSFFGNYGDRRSWPTDTRLPQCKPLPPCVSSDLAAAPAAAAAAAALSASSGTSASRPRTTTTTQKKKKKRVLFADSQGLALTDVHVFHEDEARAQLHFHLTEVEGAAAAAAAATAAASGLQPNKYARGSASDLVLDFSPPSADYLELRRRLQNQQVCLETCRVHRRFLSGTVRVQNICFQKQVWLRITWDSWSSFRDVQCLYVNNVYGCGRTDTFSFSAALPPSDPEPSDPVEFCVGFQADGRTFWDNNRGNNYRLVAPERDGQRSRDPDPDPDPYGSPRCSDGTSARWQSWGPLESDAPYW